MAAPRFGGKAEQLSLRGRKQSSRLHGKGGDSPPKLECSCQKKRHKCQAHENKSCPPKTHPSQRKIEPSQLRN